MTTTTATTTTAAERFEDTTAGREYAAWKLSLRERLQAGPDKATILAYAEDTAEAQPTAARAALAYIDAALEAYEALRLELQATLISEAVGADAWGDLLLTPEEARAEYARVLNSGNAIAALRPSTLESVADMERIPNVRLRAAVEKELARLEEDDAKGLLSRLARAVSPDAEDVDTSYIERLLGMRPFKNRPGYAPYLTLFLKYEHAVALADELNLSYHHLGV